MYSSIVNMWMIVLLFFSIHLQKANLQKQNVSVSTPMYTAVIEECPAVEKTNLNTSHIFTTDCKEWNPKNFKVASESKEDKKCMLYYDSLILFCKKFGNDSDQLFISLLTMSLKKYDENIICNELPDENLLKVKYNISTNIECLKLCFDGSNIDEKCKLAHYYMRFNVTKVMNHKNIIQSNLNKSDKKDDKVSSSSTTIKKPTLETKLSEKQSISQEKTLNSNQLKLPTSTQGDASIVSKLDQNNKKPDEIKNEQVNKEDTEINNNNIDDTDNLEDSIPNSNIGKSIMEEESDPDDDNFNEPAHENENDVELNGQMKKVKPNTVEDEPMNNFNNTEDEMEGDSYFFSYFTVLMCLCIVGYIGYHNRQKILALILEGKRGRRSSRGRRPNSINYHKLDSNLEEAISSSCPKGGSTNIIY